MIIGVRFSQEAFSSRQKLEYVTPSDPHTGFSILVQDDGHMHVGCLFIILQMEYGKLEQFFPAQVSRSIEIQLK